MVCYGRLFGRCDVTVDITAQNEEKKISVCYFIAITGAILCNNYTSTDRCWTKYKTMTELFVCIRVFKIEI